MIFIYTRKEIGDGIWFSRVRDEHFKSNKIEVYFLTEFDEMSDADFEAVGYLLTDSCAKYPTYKLLTQRCDELYDASLTNNSGFIGDMRGTIVRISVIDDRYALEGEKLERDACELLLDCILRPNTENGVFSSNVTRIVASEITDAINAKVNDKPWYAAQHAVKIAFEGEPQSRSVEGTVEQAQKITPESAWRAYRHMIERAHIEIVAAGCSDFSECEKAFTEAFSKVERHDVFPLRKPVPSPLKPQPRFVCEKLPMQQAILRMYFKLPEQTDRFGFVLLNLILGGMPMSRFFRNIREKQSLCYYCNTTPSRQKKTLCAYAGVEPKNVDRTREAVLAEIRDICENGVAEEELNFAKLESINSVTSIYDNPNALAAWYFQELLEDKGYSPEEFVEEIKAVTPERVQAVCRQMHLDTVFVLSGQEETNG